ncbi:beta-galactosidase [Tessaracoccus massiliensis]|uniref:beta-galactosidase n=1 Tax=Tessaracoccus massiliensis TaxID=1522311 RepID=UPI00111AC2E1|nr:beta-galactosidase [Tessaracoccus massiliensis]
MSRRLLAIFAVIALSITGFISPGSAQAVDPPAYQGNKITFPGNDGQPHTVTWDKNSYMVDGERLVIWSGELHHWRVPHEDGWRDVFQKLRAAGFNAVSLYFFWGLHQSEEGGEFDFTGPRDLDRLLTLAAEEGLYVIARPGPYVNAEISMGGLPAYFSNKSADSLRGTDPSVLEPSKEWLAAFNDIAREHQVTDGGGSIVMYQVENELIADNEPRRAFLKELAEFVRADGITVPLFHNDYGLGGRFSDVENLGLDFYAYDWYPLGFSCDATRGTISDQEANLRRYAPDSPNFITEAQGGAFSPWGAPWTDNDHCKTYVDPAFTRQWGMNNIGQGVTAFNYYMIIGGTNWGYTGAPGSGFTSYDYGAALDEDRTITPKLAVQKELGYYQRGVPQLSSMDPAPRIQPAELQGGATNVYQRVATDDLEDSVTGNGVRFIGARLGNSNDTSTTSFAIPLNLGEEGGVITDQFTDDDRSARISYSANWNQVADGTAYKGTLTRSATAGSTATVTFNGTGIEVIAPTSPQYGTATISIDGGAPVTMDASYNTEQNAPAQQTLFSKADLAAGNHTAVITLTGQAGANANGTAFAIDAINVLGAPSAAPTVYNNSDLDFFTFDPAPVAFRPGGTESARWTHASGHTWTAGNIDGDETYTRTAGDSVEFTFTGTGFEVLAAFSENHGPADVFIDGVKVGQTAEEVVTTGAIPQQVIFSKRDLADGEHTVRLVHTGEFFDGATDPRGAYFSVDAVRVYSADTAPEPEAPAGELAWPRIPQEPGTKLTIHGRDALMLTADLKIGGVHDMLYTTSQVFDSPIVTADGTLQTLVGYSGDAGETVLRLPAGYTVEAPASVQQTYTAATQQLRLNYTHGAAPIDITVTRADGETLILRVMDRDYAADTWMVEGIRGDVNDKVQVSGAYLVRTVTFEGTVAHITGSMDEAGTLAVTLPAGITSYTWNGGALTNGAAPGPVDVTEPQLDWVKKAEEMPVAVDFDDSDWVLANATTPLQHRQGPGRNGVVLDSNRYGFHNGSVWYRAEYTAADEAPETLSFRGNAGTFGAQRKNPGFFQVWVNGEYAGARTLNGSTQSVPVPEGAITGGEQVVVTVLANNLGLNLDWSDDGLSRQNRGLYEATLGSKAGTETWKILGSADPFGQIDQMRGMYNTGGKIGEREGWHLPGVDTTDWAPATTMKATEPGVAWYRTEVDLNVPEGQDTAWRLELDVDNFGNTHQTRTNGSQVDLYVNGWNIGVFIGDVGPQSSFTIPAGFVDPMGTNEIAVAVDAKDVDQGPNMIRLVPVHSTTGAPADFEPYPAIDQAEYLEGVRTTPVIAITSAPSELDWGTTGTITYSLTNVPAGSTLTVDAPEGWTVTPATQTTSGDTATVLVTAPASGTSGTITAKLRTPEGRTASASQAIRLTDPSVLQIDGIVAWNTAEPQEGGSNGYITALADGNTATHWHSRWSGGTTPFPHYVVLDLGSVQDVSSLTYIPRTGCGIPNNPPACNGTVDGYQVFVATEGDFVSPTAEELRQVAYAEPAGVTYTKVAEGNFGGQSTGPEVVEFDEPVKARYVKFVSTSANSGQAWSSAAEIQLSGEATTPAAPTLGTIGAQTGEVGTAVSIQPSVTGTGPFTWSATGLPAGVSINPTTGAITGTPTEAGTSNVTVTVEDAAGNQATASFTFTVAPAPTVDPTEDPTVTPTVDPTDDPTTPPTQKPTTPPVKKYVRTAPYTLPGLHKGLNGRDWNTTCEPYSQTERCRTDIWATIVVIENGQFVRKDGWTFNNLTYLPYMTREAWGANPLANTGEWTATTDQRNWLTECDTARTGRDGCRSYTFVTVYRATAKPEGGYVFSQTNEWVFNNIVMFGGPELR